MVQDTYHGSNPYDAHGPYDDDYHVIEPSRPPPVPYDDPYADFPTSDSRVHPSELNYGFGGEPNGESDRAGAKTSRGHIFSRGARGSGARSRQLRNASRRGYRNNPVASRRTFDLNADQSFLATSRMVECPTGHRQIEDGTAPHPFAQPPSNAWLSPETSHVPNYRQPFIQPHINPRFASMFGLDLPSGSMIPWGSQNAHDHTSPPSHPVDRWSMHGSAGSGGEGDTYRPM